MATGIVSIALKAFGNIFLSNLLFYLNIAFYAILCVLFSFQLIHYWKRFRSQFLNLEINMGFLSFVAANCILGSQFTTIFGDFTLGIIFLSIGFLSWFLLLYSLFAIHIEKRYKTSIKAISGTWLLIVVATQAISILSIQLVEHLPIYYEIILLIALLMFLVGCTFYVILITLIVYRLLFFEVRAQKLKTPYWISMGADAITVLAGLTLITMANKWIIINELLPFIKGLTLLFWAIGTWWIPIMVLLGIWRHFIKKIPVKYVSHYWGMVFPLGMYTVCTLKLSQSFELSFLMVIPKAFLIFSLITWIIVFIGMIFKIIR
ncbi:tellurite resistance/C4-dicarboxylate transporter family protein [Aequorivita ciconiae]|nr:tellurite resistance/C4-dicarboxylate transporter family protein [Aequorivita sp. H23M31]